MLAVAAAAAATASDGRPLAGLTGAGRPESAPSSVQAGEPASRGKQHREGNKRVVVMVESVGWSVVCGGGSDESVVCVKPVWSAVLMKLFYFPQHKFYWLKEMCFRGILKFSLSQVFWGVKAV